MPTSTEKPATAKNSSRRALLVGALGGFGAVAAGAVGRVGPVRAEGETMMVGGEYANALSVTSLHNQANDDPVFSAMSDGDGIGVRGASRGYVGVYGSSHHNAGVYGISQRYMGVWGINGAIYEPGVLGQSTVDGTGLLGFSGIGSWPRAKRKTGVYGYAIQDNRSRGVWGFSPLGHGIHGEATTGVGIFGKANKNGHALQTRGRVKHDKVSGVATIPAGSTGVTVKPPVNVTSDSFVLLTAQSNIGPTSLSVVTHPGQDNFRIRISSSRSSITKVAWLLLG